MTPPPITPLTIAPLPVTPLRTIAPLPVTPLRTIASAAWPMAGDGPEPPPVAGFVVSTFNPLVAVAAGRCLAAAPEPPPARTAVVIASAAGDAVSAEHVAQLVDGGGRVGPLLFFQSVPNAVAGHVAAAHGLAGPVLCLCPDGDPRAEARAAAALLIADGDADAALLICVAQRPDRADAELVAPTEPSVQGADR